MLDSVVLKMPLERCIIEYANLFNPSFDVFQNSNIKVCSYFPTKKENQNKYYPKIQIKRHIMSRYFTESFVLIEFSIPKLIYLNNYYEVDFEDFTEICTTLQQRLQEKCIIISINDLYKASIIQVHYSKNINITNYETCFNVLKKLSKSSISKLKSNMRDYTDGGSSLSFKNKGLNVILYDKLSEMKEYIKSSDKDSQIRRINKEILNKQQNQQIFRFEVRLNSSKKIKQLFKKFNLLQNQNIPEFIDFENEDIPWNNNDFIKKYGVMFFNIFDIQIAKTICSYYFNQITDSLQIESQSDLTTIIDKILSNQSNYKTGKLLANIGSLYIIYQYGQDYLKQISPIKLREVKKLIEDIKINNQSKNCDSLDFIRKNLESFELIKSENKINFQKSDKNAH